MEEMKPEESQPMEATNQKPTEEREVVLHPNAYAFDLCELEGMLVSFVRVGDEVVGSFSNGTIYYTKFGE